MDVPPESKISRELDNQVNLAADLATRAPVWKSRPTRLELSFNNLCNLRCVMCAKSDGEPNWLLDQAAARGFLEEVLPTVLHWTPSANSEPLLNDLDAIAELARRHTVWLHLISNGTLLTRERYEKVRERLHLLWISLDAATPATFEHIRRPARWDEVMQNLRAVLPLALEDGVDVTLNFVLMSVNWMEAADFVRLVADLGVKACNIQELLPNSSSFEELRWEGKVEPARVAAVLEQAKEAAALRKVDLKLELRPPFQGFFGHNAVAETYKAPLAELRMRHAEAISRAFPLFCPMATTYLKVTPDGGVFPCCRGPEELRMGDARSERFAEIWNGEKFQEFRRRMFAADYPAVCRDCYILVGNQNFQRATRSRA
ncbi:MAG: radical SAM protein [Planctomycetes bacterium]|nr:radical SAM protein [Planctomycetota bacterium]